VAPLWPQYRLNMAPKLPKLTPTWMPSTANRLRGWWNGGSLLNRLYSSILYVDPAGTACKRQKPATCVKTNLKIPKTNSPRQKTQKRCMKSQNSTLKRQNGALNHQNGASNCIS
jgi:hypothetical protein